MSRRGARVVLAGVAAVVGAGLLTGAGLTPPAAPRAGSTGGWGKAEEVLGLPFFKNTRWTAGLVSMSCASPGNCSAAGDYQAVLGRRPVADVHLFVVSQKHGRWSKAELLPGLAALNKGNASVTSVSGTRSGARPGVSTLTRPP